MPREQARRKSLRQWFADNRVYVAWGAVALAFAAWGFLGILAFTGTTLPWPAPHRWPVRVPVLDRSTHGQVVTAAVSWIAGTVALYTYFLNRDQKERQHRAQLQQERDIEDERELRERDFERQRERRERDLAELQRIEAEFAALADDFAQPAPLSRINAAIGLGELARRPDPRQLGENGNVLDDPRDDGAETYVGIDGKLLGEPAPWPAEWRSKKTDRNYPYFLRAAHRLAAALHQWDEDAPRAQAVRVLREMGAWAKDEGTDEPLLHALVNALAEANRTAWNATREWACLCMATDPEADLKNLLRITIEENLRADIRARRVAAADAFLADLVEGADDHSAVVAFKAVPEGQRPPAAEVLNRFHLVGKGLWATRYALAEALRQLSPPPDCAPPTDGPGRDDWVKWWRTVVPALWKRRELDLNAVRMFGADLRRAQLQGAVCTRGHFQGADCIGASFEGAYCSGTHFKGAICDGVRFKGANCSEAIFKQAYCRRAHFEGTLSTSANFEGAHCGKAHFEGAGCTQARFDAANCTGAHFQDVLAREASFKGANCKVANFDRADCSYARFEGANCSGASFMAACCEQAHFEGADCSAAIFQNADCSDAHFEGADCRGTRFIGANFAMAHIEGADLTRALLCGIHFGEGMFWSSFKGGEWAVADFKEYKLDTEGRAWRFTGKYDKVLWHELNHADPVPEGMPPRVPPWELEAGGGEGGTAEASGGASQSGGGTDEGENAADPPKDGTDPPNDGPDA